MTPRLRAAFAVLAVAHLASCGPDKPPPPPPPRPVPASVVLIVPQGSPLPARAVALLSARPLVSYATGPGVVPAAARSWSRSPDARRWTFDVDGAEQWAAAWRGPGTATAPVPGTLAIQLEAPDPDLPARLCAIAPVANGDYSPPSMLGADWRLFSHRAPGHPSLRVGSSDDPRQAVDAFRAGRLARVDFIPPDRATAVRTDPAYRAAEAAFTIVLVVDFEDPGQRAAIAAAVDARTACLKGLFDEHRAARRLAPEPLGLPEPRQPRAARPGRMPPSASLAADPGEPALLLPPLRSALRAAGLVPADPEPGLPARLRITLLAPESPALDDLFRPLRFLATDHPELQPLFDALDAATDPAERIDWARALEAALLDSRLVVPLARGRIYSLAKAGSGVELDAWGRYWPVAEASR